MQMKSVFLIMAVSLSLPSAAFGQSDMRAQQTEACQDDAYRLCPDEIPDEARVTACMARQKSRLSPACRAMFKDPPRRR